MLRISSFTKSHTKVPGVILLKPYFSSITKVEYSLKGKLVIIPIRVETIEKMTAYIISYLKAVVMQRS